MIVVYVYVMMKDGCVKKLGMLRFESNVECGYKVRELKMVYVNVKEATEVRLEFLGCYENVRNDG